MSKTRAEQIKFKMNSLLSARGNVFLESPELEYAEELVWQMCQEQGWVYHSWTPVAGFQEAQGGETATAPETKDESTETTADDKNPADDKKPADSRDFGAAISQAFEFNREIDSVVFFQDGGRFIKEAIASNNSWLLANLYWLLRDIVTNFSNVGVVISGREYDVPVEIGAMLQKIELPLPDASEIREILDSCLTQSNMVNEDEHVLGSMVNAAVGLTRLEAKLALNDITWRFGKKNEHLPKDAAVEVARLKTAKNEDKALEYYETPTTLADIGGLENLKNWLVKRHAIWLADSAETHIPKPKGILLTGLPGTGKSMTAKAVASIFGVPLLRLDVGSVFGQYYGESEAGMRNAIRAAEANAPCVLWIDEIEKGLGNSDESSAQTRETVLGTLLTWMQEKTSPVFLVATANNIQNLRPELLRKGRFDEIFFVDLPDQAERANILRLHLAKRLPESEINVESLAAASANYTGAELEQAIISAMIDSYGRETPTSTADILAAIEATVPLAVIQKAVIQDTRKWARETKAVRASSGTPEVPSVGFVTPA